MDHHSNKSMAMAVAAAAAAAHADPSFTDINYLKMQTSYIKSRSIGVLWAVFTMSFAIIDVIVFVQPQWLGDTELSRGTGYFGLWKSCRLLQDGQDLLCHGRLNDPSSIHITAFKISTLFVAISALMILICIVSMLAFFFAHPCTVFKLCGWLQFICAVCLLSGVLIFPAGWDSPAVKEVCGPEASGYNVGQCSIRWAYILAIIGVVDCFVLSILAFILGTRHTKLLPDQYLQQAMVSHHGSLMSFPTANSKSTLSHSAYGGTSSGMSQLGKLNKSASNNPLVYWK